mgnify:CR=1 FL=1
MHAVFSEQQCHAAAHAPAPNHGDLTQSAFVPPTLRAVRTVVKLDMAPTVRSRLGGIWIGLRRPAKEAG